MEENNLQTLVATASKLKGLKAKNKAAKYAWTAQGLLAEIEAREQLYDVIANSETVILELLDKLETTQQELDTWERNKEYKEAYEQSETIIRERDEAKASTILANKCADQHFRARNILRQALVHAVCHCPTCKLPMYGKERCPRCQDLLMALETTDVTLETFFKEIDT